MEIDVVSSTDSSSSYSISDSDSEEEEEMASVISSMYQLRLNDARDFCENMLFDVALSQYENDSLQCYTEAYSQSRREILSQSGCDENLIREESLSHYTEKDGFYFTRRDANLMEGGGSGGRKERPLPEPDPLLAAEEKNKKVFTIKRGASTLCFIIENYVHTTYLYDSDTGDLCFLNLEGLANYLIDYFVEYSCKKFAKVNLRYRGFVSHLLYTSSVFVETGSDNQAVSRHLLKKTIRILREECGYPSINIHQRICQNIVATGRVNYQICLHVLKNRFQDAQGKEGFLGMVIKLRDLRKYFNQEKRKGDWNREAHEYNFTANYVDDDDDSEVIQEINRVNPGGFRKKEEEEVIRKINAVTDEGDVIRNATFLVFREGQIISTGCKSEQELLEAFPLIFALLEECKSTDRKNVELEKSIIESMR